METQARLHPQGVVTYISYIDLYLANKYGKDYRKYLQVCARVDLKTHYGTRMMRDCFGKLCGACLHFVCIVALLLLVCYMGGLLYFIFCVLAYLWLLPSDV